MSQALSRILDEYNRSGLARVQYPTIDEETEQLLDYCIASSLLRHLQLRSPERSREAARVGALCKLLAEACGEREAFAARLRLAVQLVQLGYTEPDEPTQDDWREYTPTLALAGHIRRDQGQPYLGAPSQQHLAASEAERASRIFAVCAAFATLSQQRGETRRGGLRWALQQLEAQAGQQFDPELVARLREDIVGEFAGSHRGAWGAANAEAQA